VFVLVCTVCKTKISLHALARSWQMPEIQHEEVKKFQNTTGPAVFSAGAK
jgi:hypothetical protein